MPKASTQRKATAGAKHDPLAVQLRQGELADSGVLSAPGKRQKSKKRHQEEEVRPVPAVRCQRALLILPRAPLPQAALDAKSTARVLAMAREQQDELAEEDLAELADDVACVLKLFSVRRAAADSLADVQ